MNDRVMMEMPMVNYNKKCNAYTCVHCAGGLCLGCDKEVECEFTEEYFMVE